MPIRPPPPPPWLPPSQVGEMVNLKDLTDDPGDANQLLWLGLDALTPPPPLPPPLPGGCDGESEGSDG